MEAEEIVKKDNFLFYRRDGFIYHKIPSGYTSISSYCSGFTELKKCTYELLSAGEHIVFLYNDDSASWGKYYFDRFNEPDNFYGIYEKGNLVALSIAQNQELPKSWNDILEIATQEANPHREQYNRLLNKTYRVTNIRFHCCPITFVSDHSAKGWTILLQTEGLEKGSNYVLFAVNRNETICKSLPFENGTIERITEHGSIVMAKSGWKEMNQEEIIAHITLTIAPQTEKTKLSMLTKETVFQESVFHPLPFKREPKVR
jgi:hypothetical protein